MEELIQILQKPLQQKEVEVADLPDLDLYMDQITTLFADKTQEPEGLLTKTMINNYSKDGLIKPIKGKKYSKEHILQAEADVIHPADQRCHAKFGHTGGRKTAFRTNLERSLRWLFK